MDKTAKVGMRQLGRVGDTASNTSSIRGPSGIRRRHEPDNSVSPRAWTMARVVFNRERTGTSCQNCMGNGVGTRHSRSDRTERVWRRRLRQDRQDMEYGTAASCSPTHSHSIRRPVQPDGKRLATSGRMGRSECGCGEWDVSDVPSGAGGGAGGGGGVVAYLESAKMWSSVQRHAHRSASADAP
jgi:hypothetical protein